MQKFAFVSGILTVMTKAKKPSVFEHPKVVIRSLSIRHINYGAGRQSKTTLFLKNVLIVINFVSITSDSDMLYSRLSFSKNGVIRMDGFSTPDQFDDEALALWDPGVMQNSFLDKNTATYILSFIGDKFCQMVVTENTAATWVKKDSKEFFQITDILTE